MEYEQIKIGFMDCIAILLFLALTALFFGSLFLGIEAIYLGATISGISIFISSSVFGIFWTGIVRGML